MRRDGHESAAGSLNPPVTDAADTDLKAEIERLRAEVEALRMRAEAAEAAADHDVLTPTLNRRGFIAAMKSAMAFSQRHETPAVLLYLDLDGFKVVIAGAGGAAHLPGMAASMTELPVLGVPVESQALKGMDSLLSIVQMPAGVPVATVAVGNARNAGLLAVRILAAADPGLLERMRAFQAELREVALAKGVAVRAGNG